MSSKILITGAEGQLGRVLQLRLGECFEIIPTAKSPTRMALKNRNVRQMDIIDFNSVADCISAEAPDIIINCAAMTNVDACEKDHTSARKVNAEGVENIIKAVDKKTKIIQLSTDYVFEGKDGPYIESNPTHPISYYGRSKLEGENVLRGSLNPYCILRASVLYGDPVNDKPNFFAWVYDSLSKQKLIHVVTDQISNPAWLPALSDAIMKVILLNAEGIYHFGSDDHLSRYDFAVLIAKVFGLDSTLINPVTSDSMSFIAPRPVHSGLATKKITNELDVLTLSTNDCLKMIKKQILVV
ncbi:MAG: SDR family oxidoreductase [Candidatus Marinimicrobia bacterium]|nr:SDR family oxidoreductase [Candidatus Neomarinimicrobiota bacterium]